jgi:STE24 endopeptidase
MPLLLLICLFLACLPIDWHPPPFGLDTGGSAALTGGMVAGLLLTARLFAVMTVARLARDPGDREAAGRAHRLRRSLFFFLNLGGFGFVLAECGWGWTVKQWLTVDGLFLPGAEILTLAPYLVTLVGSWALFYDAERALSWTATGPALHGEYWSRGGYVLFLLRHHILIVFIPVALIIAQMGTVRANPHILDALWAKIAAFAGLCVFILLIPSLIPLVLGLRPMPPGRLRDRLEEAAARLGVRYRNLYVWDTRGNLATAMVAGVIPRFRQIAFTDLLLATLTEDEIEAVFGHEAGHVKHGHLIYYAVFLLLSFLTLGAVYQAVQNSAWGGTWFKDDLQLILAVIATGCYLFLVFGFVSRRCERQADVYGCKAVSCLEPRCDGHGPETALVRGGRGLCRTGVRIFARALERVEEVNGIARDAVTATRGGLFGRLAGAFRLAGVWLGTWQHSTIAKRVAFLRTLADDPGEERRFQWRVALLRWGLLVLLVAGVAALAAWSGVRGLLDGA